MKVFISQPMAGLPDEQILERRNECIQKLKDWYGEDKIEPIESFEKSEEIVARGRIAMLGHSIQLMHDADIVFFASGWEKSAGCNVEHEVCEQYNIGAIYEDYFGDPSKPRETYHQQDTTYWR